MIAPLKIGKENFYTVEEIAKAFGVSGMTIRSLLHSGRIAGMIIGRRWYISESSYRRFAKKAPKLGTRGPNIGHGGRPPKGPKKR